jgi:hypothetical protein
MIGSWLILAGITRLPAVLACSHGAVDASDERGSAPIREWLGQAIEASPQVACWPCRQPGPGRA